MTTNASPASAAPDSQETAQQRFHRIYITSSEICRELQVSRPSILQARRRKMLPDPIAVNGSAIFIWERAHVQPFLDAWRLVLRTRRAHAASTGTAQTPA